MVNLPAALQVVADLLSAAGCDGATPIAVPAHHYEEQEHVRGSNMPLAAALSKCYDLRSVDAVGDKARQGIEARWGSATHALHLHLAVEFSQCCTNHHSLNSHCCVVHVQACKKAHQSILLMCSPHLHCFATCRSPKPEIFKLLASLAPAANGNTNGHHAQNGAANDTNGTAKVTDAHNFSTTADFCLW